MSDPSISLEPQWAAFAAIDWGNQKHVWMLQPAAGGKRETGELPNTPEAIAVWAMQLDQRFGGRPIALRASCACQVLQNGFGAADPVFLIVRRPSADDGDPPIVFPPEPPTIFINLQTQEFTDGCNWLQFAVNRNQTSLH